MKLIKKLEKYLETQKTVDVGTNEYKAGYVDGWNDAKRHWNCKGD